MASLAYRLAGHAQLAPLAPNMHERADSSAAANPFAQNNGIAA
jgi:hypothetical protein